MGLLAAAATIRSVNWSLERGSRRPRRSLGLNSGSDSESDWGVWGSGIGDEGRYFSGFLYLVFSFFLVFRGFSFWDFSGFWVFAIVDGGGGGGGEGELVSVRE